MVPGIDLDHAEAQGQRIEAGLGVDQLQVADGAVGLLHRRAVAPLVGRDDHPRSLRRRGIH
jgi:hypothetical protein